MPSTSRLHQSTKDTIKYREPWSPINDKYYEDDSSDDNEDEEDQRDHVNVQEDVEIRVFPITPPPSHKVVNIPLVVVEQHSSPEASPSDMELVLSESD